MKTITLSPEAAELVAIAVRIHAFNLEAFAPGSPKQQLVLLDVLKQLQTEQPQAEKTPSELFHHSMEHYKRYVALCVCTNTEPETFEEFQKS